MEVLLLRLRRWGADQGFSDTRIGGECGDRNLIGDMHTEVERRQQGMEPVWELTLSKAQKIANRTGWSILSILIDAGVFDLTQLEEACHEYCRELVIPGAVRIGEVLENPQVEPWRKQAALALLSG